MFIDKTHRLEQEKKQMKQQNELIKTIGIKNFNTLRLDKSITNAYNALLKQEILRREVIEDFKEKKFGRKGQRRGTVSKKFFEFREQIQKQSDDTLSRSKSKGKYDWMNKSQTIMD